MGNRKNVFVLMPFGDAFDIFYFAILKPLLEEMGYDVSRADDLNSQQNIMKDIVEGIYKADLIIADLSDHNPNVYYELGLSHNRKIPTILITKDPLEELPFDIRYYRVNRYSMKSFETLNEFTIEIEDLASKALQGSLVFGNPLMDWGSEFVKIEETTQEIYEHEDGLWDILAKAEENFIELPEIVIRISEKTKNIGKKLEDSGKQIQEIKIKKEPGSLTKIKKLVDKMADEFDAYSQKMEPDIENYNNCVKNIYDTTTGFIQKATIESDEDIESLNEFVVSCKMLIETTEEAMGSIILFKESVKSAKGLSKRLDIATEKVVTVLQKLVDYGMNSIPIFEKIILFVNDKTEVYMENKET